MGAPRARGIVAMRGRRVGPHGLYYRFACTVGFRVFVRRRMRDVLLGDVFVLSSRMPRVLPVHCAGLGVYIVARCLNPTKTRGLPVSLARV